MSSIDTKNLKSTHLPTSINPLQTQMFDSENLLAKISLFSGWLGRGLLNTNSKWEYHCNEVGG